MSKTASKPVQIKLDPPNTYGGLRNQAVAEWLSENGIVPSWVVANQPEGLPTWESGLFTALLFDHDGEGNKVLRRNPLTGQVKVDDEFDMMYMAHVESLECKSAPPVSLHV